MQNLAYPKVVKQLARKKKAEDPGAGQPWLATFADLMNLLLCFFVLLFASSTVDAAKYEEIVNSMSATFGIYSSGKGGVDGDRVISSGINQIRDLDGHSAKDKIIGDENTPDSKETEDDVNVSKETDALKELMEMNKGATLVIYDDVAEKAKENQLGKYIELSVDPSYHFVKISLSGSILFDSGKAEIKASSLPVFSKLADILTNYKDHHIGIEGHTDNRPIHSGSYPNNNWLSSARALNAATYLIQEKGMNPNSLSWTGRGEYEPVAKNSTDEGRAKNRRVEIKIYNNINN